MENFETNMAAEKANSATEEAAVAAESGGGNGEREIQPVASQPAPAPSTEEYKLPVRREPDKQFKRIKFKHKLRTEMPMAMVTMFVVLAVIASINLQGGSGTGIIIPLLIYMVFFLTALAVAFALTRMNAEERKVVERIRNIVAGNAHIEGKMKGRSAEREFWGIVKDGDKERFETRAAEEEKKIDAYIQAVRTRYAPNAGAVENNGEGTFDGWLIQKIGWNILSALVTLITLGIAFPVTVVWKEKWRCKHTVYEGRRLRFDGRASQLIGNWLLWMFLSVVTCGIFILFIPGKIKKWKAKHTRLAGEYVEFGSTFDGWLGQEVLLLVAGLAVSVCTLFIGVPFAMSWMARWRCNHTVLDGKRLRFDGKAVQLLGRYVVWLLLSVVTLSIYAWFIPNRFNKWKAKHTRLAEGYELC